MFETDRLAPGISADLLQPSISVRRPLYSPGVLAMTAFFGGLIAVSIVFALNAKRLGRLGRDLWLVLLGFGGAFWMLELPAGDGRQRFLLRVLALAFAGLLWLFHRQSQRSQSLWQGPAKHGFWVGLGAVGAALAISIAWVSLRRELSA